MLYTITVQYAVHHHHTVRHVVVHYHTRGPAWTEPWDVGCLDLDSSCFCVGNSCTQLAQRHVWSTLCDLCQHSLQLLEARDGVLPGRGQRLSFFFMATALLCVRQLHRCACSTIDPKCCSPTTKQQHVSCSRGWACGNRTWGHLSADNASGRQQLALYRGMTGWHA